jgi:hypothetical protein
LASKVQLAPTENKLKLTLTLTLSHPMGEGTAIHASQNFETWLDSSTVSVCSNEKQKRVACD